MKFFRCLRCDLTLAVKREWKLELLLAVMVMVFCGDFYLRARYRMLEPFLPDMQDYLFFLFGGVGEYIPSKTESFVFSPIWMCLMGYVVFLTLRYPREEFYEIGQQIYIRFKSRILYWISKGLVLLIKTALHAGICFGMVYLFTVLTGGSVFESLNLECIANMGRMIVNSDAKAGIPAGIYLLPFCMVFCLAQIQSVLSFLVGNTISFLGILLILISSSYKMSPYFPGNLGMIYRNRLVMLGGLEGSQMLVFVLILGMAVWIVGGIWFCRMDFLKREELG